MGISLVAWSESVGGAVTQQNITAVPDQHVRTEGDNIVVPEYNKLVGLYGIGVDIQNAQLSSPSMRRFILNDISPVENVALPVFPPDFISRVASPIVLDVEEQLTGLAGNSNVGAQQESLVVAISDGNVQPVAGPSSTMRATAVAPAIAYGWANAQLVFTQVLPVGTYKIIGARCEQANTIAFRFVFVGGTWRPGTISVVDAQAKDIKDSRFGMMGVWGTFEHLTPPTIDFFGDGTGGAAVIFIDLIKV